MPCYPCPGVQLGMETTRLGGPGPLDMGRSSCSQSQSSLVREGSSQVLTGLFWVCLCLVEKGYWGWGCRQQLPPSSQLSRPALCQEGRESWHSHCSLAQTPVCLHRSLFPLFSLPASPGPTGVAEWGAGQGPGCWRRLRVSWPGFVSPRTRRLASRGLPTPTAQCLIFVH